MITESPKILVADDDTISRILILEILENFELTILECETGFEALKCFEVNKDEITLLILDIKLPQLDGWTLLSKMRALKPSIPAIAISALFPEDFYYKSKSLGFEAYLSKPIDIEVFKELISLFLNQSNESKMKLESLQIKSFL